MKTLIDFSQLVIAAVAVNSSAFKGEDAKAMVKHVAFSQLLSLKKKFKSDLILCCDAKTYWRRDIFPAYKGHRKHKKKNSLLDWDMVSIALTELKADLLAHFPYTVLEIDGCEADDIIASLCKHFQDNDLDTAGLFETPRAIVICSTDKDFQQLQKYKNVSQWNNIEKKMIKCADPRGYLLEHILTGDGGDNVPNVCTSDVWAIDRSDNVTNKLKATSFMSTRVADFSRRGIDACINPAERIHFKRNEILVDFDKIPEVIYNSIIAAYSTHEVQGSKMKVFNYLSQNRMKLLLGDYASF